MGRIVCESANNRSSGFPTETKTMLSSCGSVFFPLFFCVAIQMSDFRIWSFILSAIDMLSEWKKFQKRLSNKTFHFMIVNCLQFVLELRHTAHEWEHCRSELLTIMEYVQETNGTRNVYYVWFLRKFHDLLVGHFQWGPTSCLRRMWDSWTKRMAFICLVSGATVADGPYLWVWSRGSQAIYHGWFLKLMCNLKVSNLFGKRFCSFEVSLVAFRYIRHGHDNSRRTGHTYFTNATNKLTFRIFTFHHFKMKPTRKSQWKYQNISQYTIPACVVGYFPFRKTSEPASTMPHVTHNVMKIPNAIELLF